jgi:hypothetical protein
MTRYKIDYTFEEKRKRLDNENVTKYNMIPFADGYLYYKSNPLRNSILLNGLSEVNTKEIEFAKMNDFDAYLNIFEESYGSRNVAKGFKNILDLMLDPITIDILKDMKLPTDVLGVLLYTNTLLEDNSYSRLNSMENYRLRSIELINVYLYKILADAVKDYKQHRKSGNSDVRISVPKDKLIKDLLTSNIVDEYSILNPVLEIEKLGSTNYKGPSGTNLDSAFTPEMRAYDKSMVGLIGMSTPDSFKVGVVRQLSMNTKVINNRGMIDTSTPVEDFDATNIFTCGELLNSYTATHADPPRIGMETQQNKHAVPTVKQTKPLFGSGVEKSLPYMLSTDFVYVSKTSGKIEKIDKEEEVAIVKYDDGTSDIIDLSSKQSKNSNGGFYISNQKELMLKEGQRFKPNEILAKNPDYFIGNNSKDVVYSKGNLMKVAIHEGDFTLEDSSIITNKISEDMSCLVTMMKKVQLGQNANIIKMAKKGQHIKAGDNLLVFEHSFDDAEANRILDSLDDDSAEFIEGIGQDSIVAKYSGEIVDIKVYYNVPLEECSESLQKMIKSYNAKIKKLYKIAETHGNSSLILPPCEQIKDDKIKGVDMQGVSIEFYIRHKDRMKIGDKIVYGTALKTIVSDVIKDGEEPYSELNKDENVDAILSPLSIVSRMTTDIYNIMYSNKLILELKRQCKEIWNS